MRRKKIVFECCIVHGSIEFAIKRSFVKTEFSVEFYLSLEPLAAAHAHIAQMQTMAPNKPTDRSRVKCRNVTIENNALVIDASSREKNH